MVVTCALGTEPRRFKRTKRGVGVARLVRAPSRVMICEDCHREATIATKRATCAPPVKKQVARDADICDQAINEEVPQIDLSLIHI